MTYSLNALNLPVLVQETDQTALLSAYTTMLGTDFAALLAAIPATLGLPSVVDPTEPTLTNVPLVFTNDPGNLQTPETLTYRRLDMASYFAGSQRYVGLTDAQVGQPLAPIVTAWFLSKLGIYFDATKLTVVVGSALSDDPLATAITVSVDPSNYLWVGSVTLYTVPQAHVDVTSPTGVRSHLALFAAPGTASGMILGDVQSVV